MDCKKVKANLASLLENQLTGQRRLEMEQHVECCPCCRRRLQEFSRLWEELEHPQRIPASPYFWTRLKPRLVECEEGTNPVRDWLEKLVRRARPAMAVAVLLACVFLGHSLGNFPQQANGQTTSQLDKRTVALQQFFDSYNLNLLEEAPTGSLEATYLEIISGK